MKMLLSPDHLCQDFPASSKKGVILTSDAVATLAGII
jgi:hypothetical protein